MSSGLKCSIKTQGELLESFSLWLDATNYDDHGQHCEHFKQVLFMLLPILFSR